VIRKLVVSLAIVTTLLLGAVAIGVAAWFSAPPAPATQDPMGSMPGDHAVPSVNPDPRVEWVVLPAGGRHLARLAAGDTTGTHWEISPALPAGSLVLIPYQVPDKQEGD